MRVKLCVIFILQSILSTCHGISCHICHEGEGESEKCFKTVSDPELQERVELMTDGSDGLKFHLTTTDDADICLTVRTTQEFLHALPTESKLRIGIKKRGTKFPHLSIDRLYLDSDCQDATRGLSKVRVCGCGYDYCNHGGKDEL